MAMLSCYKGYLKMKNFYIKHKELGPIGNQTEREDLIGFSITNMTIFSSKKEAKSFLNKICEDKSKKFKKDFSIIKIKLSE